MVRLRCRGCGADEAVAEEGVGASGVTSWLSVGELGGVSNGSSSGDGPKGVTMAPTDEGEAPGLVSSANSGRAGLLLGREATV